MEIPDISNYAGICFQKLFITNAANILALKYFDSDVDIIGDEIIVKHEHDNGGINQRDGIVSLNKVNNINGSILIYLGFYNDAGQESQPRSFSLKFDVDKCNQFMDDVNASFYHLANSIFLSSSKI